MGYHSRYPVVHGPYSSPQKLPAGEIRKGSHDWAYGLFEPFLFQKKNGILDENVNYCEKMRKFVGRISAQAKSTRPNFAVIPQNGLPILTQNGEPEGPIAEAYLQAIDGVGCEELLCGYEGDDKPTSAEMTQFWKGFLDLVKSHGKQALIIDYCRT